jgi:hypothetical protein
MGTRAGVGAPVPFSSTTRLYALQRLTQWVKATSLPPSTVRYLPSWLPTFSASIVVRRTHLPHVQYRTVKHYCTAGHREGGANRIPVLSTPSLSASCFLISSCQKPATLASCCEETFGRELHLILVGGGAFYHSAKRVSIFLLFH